MESNVATIGDAIARSSEERILEQSSSAQQSFFRATDSVPEEAWYWAAVVSIIVSAVLKMMNKEHWSLFVGQWPPTFLLFGVYHRLVQPGK